MKTLLQHLFQGCLVWMGTTFTTTAPPLPRSEFNPWFVGKRWKIELTWKQNNKINIVELKCRFTKASKYTTREQKARFKINKTKTTDFYCSAAWIFFMICYALPLSPKNRTWAWLRFFIFLLWNDRNQRIQQVLLRVPWNIKWNKLAKCFTFFLQIMSVVTKNTTL